MNRDFNELKTYDADLSSRVAYGVFCGRSTTGIAGSNFAGGMHIRLMCSLCGLQIPDSTTSLSLVQKNHTERVCVIQKSQQRCGLGPI